MKGSIMLLARSGPFEIARPRLVVFAYTKGFFHALGACVGGIVLALGRDIAGFVRGLLT